MGRFLPAFAGAALLLVSLGCNRADESRAKQEARDLGRKIDHAVNSGGTAQGNTTRGAEEKLRKGGEDLRVAGEKAGVKLDRAALIAKVKAKLATDVGLSTATAINVDAQGQVVTLKGTVASQGQKHQAEETVRQLEGVSRVVNELTVAP